MARKMTLPKIGVNMTEAVVTKWLVAVGDKVAKGDAIIEAETDKSTQEIYSTEAGIVAELLCSEGDTVKTHEPVMVFIDEGEIYSPDGGKEDLAETIEMEEVPTQEKAPQKVERTPVLQQTVSSGKNRVRISPLAKRMAKDLGIDFTKVEPGVAGARIVAKDIEAYKEKASSSFDYGVASYDEELERIPMSGVRKTIASRMLQSTQERPTVPLVTTADATALIALRKRYGDRGISVSFDAMLARIAAKTLCKNRYINTVLDGNDIVVKKAVNIGVAVDAQSGLIVPVVKNADTKDLTQIGEELASLTKDAQEGSLALEDMQGSTFTITNLGMFGVEQFAPIINPPECCILGVGAIKKQFVPDENDNPVVKNLFQLTLVFDHRMVDGAPAARFLRDFKDYVEMPELLI